MSQLNATLLRSSFAMIVDREPAITHHFYELLFHRYPQVKPLFTPGRMKDQERMLADALVAVLEHIENPSWLADQLTAMGAKHVEYGVQDEMYPWVGECLIAALSRAAGPTWTPEHSQAWTAAYSAISDLMLAGANHYRSASRASADAS